MNYKLIKLNNGEELIGDVSEKETTIVVNNPMVFVTATLSDPSGIPIDVTMLRDWLNHSDNKNVEIEKTKIIIMTEPGQKTIHYYNKEMSKQLKTEVVDNPNNLMDEMGKIFDQMIQDASNNVFDNFEPMHLNQDKSKNKKKKKKTNPDKVDEPEMIYLSMMIPPEVLMNMVTSGIVDPEALKMMLDETKKKHRFTGDEKKRKDFGNKYSDWNPDPSSDDYK